MTRAHESASAPALANGPVGVSNRAGGTTGALVQAGTVGGSATAQGYANAGVHIGNVNLVTGDPVTTHYDQQLARIAPPELIGRDAELAELATFCTTTAANGTYAWWQGEAWSGKSALMSWFALHPPAGVRVVSFFVTARWAGQADRSAFMDNVMEQLLALLGRRPPSLVTESTREVHLLGLLEEAAHACRDRAEQLILLVDGLDEDQGAQSRPGVHSIAAVLPARLPEGLRVVLAGRPSPPVPADVPAHHPLRQRTIIRTLAPSPHARILQEEMTGELKRLLQGSVVEQDLLGLITAAGGGLSAADLAELTALLPWQVDEQLHAVTGRNFTRRGSRHRPGDAPEVYLLGHEELQRTAVQMLGPVRLGDYRERLHGWADLYRKRRWPADTPEYLLGGYVAMLAATADLPRMVRCATDPARHDRMLEVSGADTDALAEIASTQALIAGHDTPDLAAMVRLAVHRTRLRDRATRVPPFASSWAGLGRLTRAETVARVADAPGSRAAALAAVATAAAKKGETERALRLLDEAESAARAPGERTAREDALKAVATAAAQVGALDRAQSIAFALDDALLQARTLAIIARSDAVRSDVDRSFRYAAHIEHASESVTTDAGRCQLLLTAAQVTVGAGDLARARQLLDKAEQIATRRSQSAFSDDLWESIALAFGHLGDTEHAEALIDRIDTAYAQASALCRLINQAMGRDATERVTALITRTEAIARSITGSVEQAQRLLWLAVPAARNGDHTAGMRLLTEAVHKIRLLDNTLIVDSLLREASQVAAQIGEFDYAETLIDEHIHPVMADSTREWVVRNLAFAGHLDRAHALARAITTPVARVQALEAVADAAADRHDAQRTAALTSEAEAVARRFTDNIRRTRELAVLAVAAADHGDDEQASTLLVRAEGIARSITYDMDRSRALEAVTHAATEIGLDPAAVHHPDSTATPWDEATPQSSIETAISQGHLQHARDLARSVTDSDHRVTALRTVASALANAGDIEDAWDLALTIAQPGARAAMMASIARSAAHSGAHETAADLLGQAHEQAWTLTSPAERARTLAALAEAQYAVGDLPGANESIELARETAELADGDFGEPQYTQAAVATAAEHVGLAETAESIAVSLGEHFVARRVWNTLAESAAKSGDYDRVRRLAAHSGQDEHAPVLTRAAVAAAAQGRVDIAVELLVDSERIAATTCDDGLRGKMMADIVQALASVGAFEHAYTIAFSIEGDKHQIQALLALCSDLDVNRRTRILGRLLHIAPWHLSARELIRMDSTLLEAITHELSVLPEDDLLEHQPTTIGRPVH